MNFVSIEELSSLSGLNRRSVDRKLVALKKADPDRYNLVVQREGKKLTYNAAELVGYLKSGVKPMPAEKPLSSPLDMPKEVRQKFSRLNQPNRTERKTKKFHKAVAKELSKEPDIIALEPEFQKDFMDLTIKDQRNMLTFAAAMNDYETGLYTLGDSLLRNGMSFAQFYNLIDKKVMFAAVYAKSVMKHKKAYNLKLRDAAGSALLRMVEGYDKEMATTNYIQRVSPTGEAILIPMERKIQQKHVLPNVNAIIFALTNRDPEEWKRMFIPSNNIGEKQQDPLEKMSDQELMDYIGRAKEQGLLGEGGNPTTTTTI